MFLLPNAQVWGDKEDVADGRRIFSLVLESFDSIESVQEINNLLKTMLPKDAMGAKCFRHNIADWLSKRLTGIVGQDFKLDINNVWTKYSDSGNLYIITFTLYMSNKYFLSIIYRENSDHLIVAPSHIDHHLNSFLLHNTDF